MTYKKTARNEFDRCLFYLCTSYNAFLSYLFIRFQDIEVWRIWKGAVLLPLIEPDVHNCQFASVWLVSPLTFIYNENMISANFLGVIRNTFSSDINKTVNIILWTKPHFVIFWGSRLATGPIRRMGKRKLLQNLWIFLWVLQIIYNII